MMFQFTDDDLIAGADVLATVALRDQIHCLGGAAHENNLLGVRCAEKFAHFLPARLEQFGRSAGEGVRGAVDIGIIATVKLRGRVNHRLRLLRGGRVVQPDQRFPIDELVQCGKIAAHAFNVEWGDRRGGFRIRLTTRRRLARSVAAAKKVVFRRG